MKLDPRGPALLVLGIYLILGSVYNWRMLIYGRGSHGTRTLFGEKGARWVYGVLGAVLLLLGVAGIIASFT